MEDIVNIVDMLIFIKEIYVVSIKAKLQIWIRSTVLWCTLWCKIYCVLFTNHALITLL